MSNLDIRSLGGLHDVLGVDSGRTRSVSFLDPDKTSSRNSLVRARTLQRLDIPGGSVSCVLKQGKANGAHLLQRLSGTRVNRPLLISTGDESDGNLGSPDPRLAETTRLCGSAPRGL